MIGDFQLPDSGCQNCLFPCEPHSQDFEATMSHPGGRLLFAAWICGRDGILPRPWVLSCCTSQYKTTPPVRSDRGRKMHGTTSGAVKPHNFTLRPSSNGSRCIGRTRPTLLLLRADHSGRYFGVLSRCLAPPGSSLAERGTPTSSHPCVSLLGLS